MTLGTPRRDHVFVRLARARTPTTKLVRGVVGVAAFLLLAEIAVRLAPISTDYLPPSSAVLGQVAKLLVSGDFLADVAATSWQWVAGLTIATAVAVPAGVLLGSVPALRTATRSLVEFLRPIPPVAMIPLAILLFGGGAQMKLVLIVYAAVWPILFNTVYALQDVDPVAKDTVRAFGFGRLAVLWKVSLPSAAPFIATGVRVSAGVALILAVSAGLLAGGESGIGTFIIQASSGAGNTDLVLAAATLAGVLGYAGNALLEYAQRRLFGWHFARNEGQS